MNTINCFRSILITGIILVASFTLLMAQEEEDKKIYRETVDVVRAYMPKITDALKLDVVPVGERIDIVKPEITYTARATLIKVETTKTDKIPPVVLIKSQQKDLNRAYIKAGYGNYNNIFAEGYYNTINLRDKSFAAHVLHHSGRETPKYTNISQQYAQLTGSQTFNGKTLSARAFIDNNRLHYYGFADTNVDHDTVTAQFFRQNFLLSGFDAGFTNKFDKRSKINFDIDAGLYNFNDYNRLHETGISVKGKIQQDFYNNPISFEAIFNHYIINSVPNYNRNVFDIRARYHFIRDDWNIEAGFDAPTQSDSVESRTHFYPIIKAQAKLVNKYIYGFAAISGGLEINNYRSLAYENPYIVSDFILKNTNNKFVFSTGFKGNIADKAGYILSYSFHDVEDLLMFANDTVTDYRFIAYYDSGSTQINKLQGEIMFNPLADLQIYFGTNYFFYKQNDTTSYPWHLPVFDLKTSIKYSLQNKVYLTIDYFLIGKRKTLDLKENKMLDLKEIHDLNAGITYNFSNKYGIFFNFNNILNTKYSYWNQYQLRGFHFMAGLKGSF